MEEWEGEEQEGEEELEVVGLWEESRGVVAFVDHGLMPLGCSTSLLPGYHGATPEI